ncbi:hypothetical protein EVAR_10039_1 [Eumeta japonica]|uniref:Uncharacterized protein n=1 Tax=Eumeta variegata TaxID=151549 RepID=A0A4C1TRC1_EUMVA|nr:hypothetical protein EVAR_10039_1 [Eumeta japonica]
MEVTPAVESFNNSIQQAAWVPIPNQPGCKKDMYIYPKYIQKLIQEKKKAIQVGKTIKYPEDKAKFNKLTSELKEALARANGNKGISVYLSNLDTTKATEYSF